MVNFTLISSISNYMPITSSLLYMSVLTTACDYISVMNDFLSLDFVVSPEVVAMSLEERMLHCIALLVPLMQLFSASVC